MADIVLEHEKPTTSRKGWASLSAIAKSYRMPNGDWLKIRCYEDMDAWEKAWADHRGQALEVEQHETRTNDGGGKPTGGNPDEAEAIAFIRDYTGTFGFILDLRARRGWGTKWYSLSDAQVAAVLRVKARENAPRPEPVAPVVQSAPMTDGMFRKDGVIFKVQKAIHGSGQLYAKTLVIDGPGEGHFEYTPGAIKTLTLADKMTPAEAAEFGRLYGICVVCGIALTDEKSIEAGIGPICAKRV